MRTITLLLVAFLLNGCSAAQLQRWVAIKDRQAELDSRQPDPQIEVMKANAARRNQNTNCTHTPVRDHNGNVTTVYTNCY